MTLIEERTLRLQAEGYWAVEIRISGRGARGPHSLCHAASDRAAGRMAAHLMGGANSVRGFNYCRVEPPIRNQAAEDPPPLGGHKAVAPEAWPDLMFAHAASEAAFMDHLSRTTPLKGMG
jgi:hypothetical protein